ncbi:TIGR00730 family Rossman fold protein [Lacticaseibacillus pabuli]|uniref:Cytokinin riboside 5'-monophosphate phosphoribohydrolase n=1 Tax=Lacticaseibacillus pabuli TaxID=3025672 RepID=A0ABY7WZP7_9LACO|nr:TIGR00730 family Rossman fold protein [Lacticaseibacillus sp. KACC 23028]WDF83365.1 TIGR00730 family Rossman fold protein [Lacticaseibacillus sp. KACC 23028]
MKLTVFCGARFGRHHSYEQVANALGWYMGRNGFDLVYGGSQSGIMGVISGAVLAAGGEVTGISPAGMFESEVPRENATYNIVTNDMDERKRKLMEEADAFFVFPGGLGTLEELAQTLSWMAIDLLPVKPIAIFNMNHYYDSLVNMLDVFVQENFASPEVMDHVFISDNFESLLQQVNADASGFEIAAEG